VIAALSLPWSNGQTEGQINRLKLIKRDVVINHAALKSGLISMPSGI
jgi:hypothetical protein